MSGHTVKLEKFRQELEAHRKSVDQEGRSLKDSYLPLDRLRGLYRKFDEEQRILADHVFTEWVLSDDENMRFDALALIDDFKITNAMPSLRSLAERLALSRTPGAAYELQKVDRILRDLGEQRTMDRS